MTPVGIRYPGNQNLAFTWQTLHEGFKSLVRLQGIRLCGLQICLENDELKVSPQVLKALNTIKQKSICEWW